MNNNFRFRDTGNVFLITFVAFTAASAVLSLIFGMVYTDNGREIPLAAEICLYLANPIVFIAVPWLFAYRRGVSFTRAAKLRKGFTPAQAGIVVLLSFACIAAFLPITNTFLDLLELTGFKLDLPFMDTQSSAGAFFLGLLLMCVLPALGEEFFMRGAVLNAAEQRRDYSHAILLTASLFSLMHGNPIQTVHQFLLGMVLAYLTLSSRSLWPAVLLHFTNNFLALVLDYPLNWFVSATGIDRLPLDSLLAVRYVVRIVSAVLGCVIVLYLLKKFTKSVLKTVRPSSEEVIDMVENEDGVYVAESRREARMRERANDFAQSFRDIAGIFRRGGVRAAYDSVNDTIKRLRPEDDPYEFAPLFRGERLTRSLRWAYGILIFSWIAMLVAGYTDLLVL